MFAHRITAMATNSSRAVLPFGFLHSININSKVSCLPTIPLSAPFSSTVIHMCHSTQAMKGNTDVFLGGVADKDTIEDVKRIVELANRALSRREVCHTDFLTPTVLKESMTVLDKFMDIKMVAQGGYPEAERCRLSIGHPDILPSDPDIVAALNVSGNFGFGSCCHGDFLGSILGTGIVRDKVGDIILQGELGAHVLIVPELVDFLASSLNKDFGAWRGEPNTITLQLADRSLTYPRGILDDVPVKVDKFIFPADFVILDIEEDQDAPLIFGRPFLATGKALIDVHKGELTLRVGGEEVLFNIYNAIRGLNEVRNVSVTCVKMPLLAVEYEPPRTRSLKTVEASLRLDAVASAGFKISRSKMASLVSDGDVRVNWIATTKNNTTIKSGDVISVSGKGRLKIGEINSTRKGKFAVELFRYL